MMELQLNSWSSASNDRKISDSVCMNPWLEIPLEDYEAHMSMASVAQAQFLAQVLGRRVRELAPKSVAVIGCAGGNGFEQLPSGLVERVVGVDINPHFIATTRRRYFHHFNRLELICDDFLNLGQSVEPVDFVYAGLIFEYVNYLEGLASIMRFLKPEGHLSVVLQMPNDFVGPVSPTPYTSLNKLEGSFKFVQPKEFEHLAMTVGLGLRMSKQVTLESGKSFHEFLFKRSH